MKNILVLCTGNSARSILGEALFNDLGSGRVAAWSAGSRPKGEVHPRALATLAGHGHPTTGLRSKSWDEFASASAPAMDIVITVCDAAAGESCPIWPGAPVRAHWGIPDPAAAEASQIDAAFEGAYRQLRARIVRFLELDFEKMVQGELADALRRIGEAAKAVR